MPSQIFKELWQTIQNKAHWHGIVKNITKDGVLVEYKSLRSPISDEDKLKHQKLYDKIRKENGEKIRKITYE
jgi:aerotaxis receptor